MYIKNSVLTIYHLKLGIDYDIQDFGNLQPAFLDWGGNMRDAELILGLQTISGPKFKGKNLTLCWLQKMQRPNDIAGMF